MTRWTEEELAAYERRQRNGRPLGALDVSTPGGESAIQETARRARGNKATMGQSARSKTEELLAHQLNELMRLGAIREYHFSNIDPGARGWRFDFAFPDAKLLVEIHGALGTGKHSRKAGQSNDLEKANAATEHGWSVLSYSAAMVNSGAAALQIERIVRKRRSAAV